MIGSFGTHSWNIHDMEPYKNKKPRYVREWYLKLKARMKKINDKKGKYALDMTLSKVEKEQKH